MPKRTDLKKILILGAGPITIGQACEFDYSGSQACKALKQEGYEVVLVNSNPATIMTDPSLADRTYIEPVDLEFVTKIIELERPCALLATMGGQTALNVAFMLAKSGVLAKYKVELIGAKLESIEMAEDRELFKRQMLDLGFDVPKSFTINNTNELKSVAQIIGYPIIIRPAFTLGGAGGGIAYNHEELEQIVLNGLNLSPINQVLLEESVYGYKEIELEVMRDCADNSIVICSIENIDPMGVHTGDSITVAPVQTISDREYQVLRDMAIKIIRVIGIESGGSNVQFGINPQNGRIVVIEMNPRVSRSSALASKATGYPIAKISAKLAVGMTLDEITNDITLNTKACFEPSLDYVVVKIPRFNFDKFKGCDTTLTTAMKSVGEVMAIGRTFNESFQKALRGLELGINGFEIDKYRQNADYWQWRTRLVNPSHHRITDICGAYKFGLTIDEINELTKIDKWFLTKLFELHQMQVITQDLNQSIDNINLEFLYELKANGFSDRQIADFYNTTEDKIFDLRKKSNIMPVYKTIDTCSSEFVSFTPYMYSSYDKECELEIGTKPSVIVLGGGPNRIGQGIEFDYACVHACKAIQDMGYEAIMINSNPETVSTDYDSSDKLFFEPLTLEDVSNIALKQNPIGIIVQTGGQTPLKLTNGLKSRGFNILGTSPENIDLAEDRYKFNELMKRLGVCQPKGGFAYSRDDVVSVTNQIGFPVLVRPSYVLGGKQMEIIYNLQDLENWLNTGITISQDAPILIDEFLEGAVEIDVDAIGDGRATIICGIMEHIEQAGIHSGDSTCVLPAQTIPVQILEQIKDITNKISLSLNVIGLLNIQFALKDNKIYILEANPRASRTIPFVSKATGVNWAYLATKLMLGKKISELNINPKLLPPNVCVKSVVIPFKRFSGATISLGPEMRSTGEVMGISHQFGHSYAKAQIACGNQLPTKGTVFISVSDKYKTEVIPIALNLYQLGFELIATSGTASSILKAGIAVTNVNKIFEGRPNLIDRIKNNEVSLVINVPSGKMARSDDQLIRQESINHNIPVVTTLSGAKATVQAISALIDSNLFVKPLQDYHNEINKKETKFGNKLFI